MGQKGVWKLSAQGVERAKNFIKDARSDFDSTDVEYTFFEGNEEKVFTTKYERSLLARNICLEVNGLNCFVCDFNFEKVYGVIGKEFMHVHHKKAISLNKNEETDPAKDLVPVCPNCHAMLHKRSPPFSIEEMKQIISSVS